MLDIFNDFILYANLMYYLHICVIILSCDEKLARSFRSQALFIIVRRRCGRKGGRKRNIYAV